MLGYAEIQIVGRNRELLFKKLEKAEIPLLNIKIIDEKSMFIRVPQKDCQKVFAICGNMWYNKLIRLGGLANFWSFFKKRVGLFIGLIAVIIAINYSNKLLFGVEVNGLKSISQTEFYQHIEKFGIKKYQNIDSIDIKSLQSQILSLSDKISFVVTKKSANKLIINVFEEKEVIKPLAQTAQNITSAYFGKVKSIAVYRGRQNVKVGDEVKVGDVLIYGEILSGDETQEVCALGKIILSCSAEFEYAVKDFNEYEKQLAVSRARFALGEYEIEQINAEELQNDGGSYYVVTATYLVQIGG